MKDIVLSTWLERMRGRIADELLQAVESGQVPPVWAEAVEHGLPHDVPPRPDRAYSDWRGWDDFLGTTGWDEWCQGTAKRYRKRTH